jgi:hypothetical protein
VIDAWSGPTPVSNQFPANEPNGIRKLLDKITALERQIKESTSNLLRTAGIYLSPTGMTIDSNLALTGTLSLPAGIIGNDALTSPVVPQSVFGSVSNFALTARHPVTTADVISTTTITVPAGVTSAVVTVLSRVFAINNNSTGGTNGAGSDYLYAQTGIAGFLDTCLPLSTGGSGGSNINISPFAKVLTGLTPGGTFTITIGACSDYLNWAASASNLATVSGNILWFR